MNQRFDATSDKDLTFSGSFTQQDPIPAAGIDAAMRVLQSGRLHRYNLATDERGEVAGLEADFAAWLGSTYCLAVTSGGQAMQIALRASGVKPGSKVLTNAFTLAPVPGAIHLVGAEAVLVEIDANLRLDIDDLAAKAKSSGARHLLLSHMRGHLCDMNALMDCAKDHGLTVIEDCAHTMGAAWYGRKSGTFGHAACFSTQTYKHINSGEGGLLTSNDPDFMARATILSGSYMLYERHGAGPDADHYDEARYEMANGSARMDALRAAVLRPQLGLLQSNIDRWNLRYQIVSDAIEAAPGMVIPERPEAESMVGSSIQFRAPDFSPANCKTFVAKAGSRGVELKWFGAPEPKGFTSAHGSWRYLRAQALPKTDAILSTLFDMRLPLTFGADDCHVIGRILNSVAHEMAS